jgi:formate hydrogenlyase subunit 3/multisubunit Na+/H+ antiporter MnhD subunit
MTIAVSVALRNDTRAASIIAAAGSFVCGTLIFFVPIDRVIEVLGISLKVEPTWQILGRALALDDVTQPMVGFIYLSTGFLLLPAWLTGGSRYFPALALATAAAAAAALMARPFLYAAIFIEFAAIGGGLILVSRRAPRNLGALRLLVLYTLAMLIILITGWALDQGSITSTTTAIANRTTMALIFGFAVLVLIPPFHIWLINASQEAHPYALAFVVLLLQSAAIFFLFRFLDIYPWLRENQITFQALRLGGMLCLAVGVPLAASQRDLPKVVAYMVIADVGFSLLAISAASTAGYRLALGMTASRIISLGVLSLGSSILFIHNPQVNARPQAENRDLVPKFVVFAGMLSLSGFPLTAGFPGRWSLLTNLMASDSIYAYLAFLAYLGFCGTAIWWGYRLLRDHERWEIGFFSLEQIFLFSGVMIVFLLGLFPQLTYPWIVDLVSGLTRLFS